MVFGIIGMVNFAHGDVFMLSTFIALIFLLALTQILGIGSLAVAFFIVLDPRHAAHVAVGMGDRTARLSAVAGLLRLAPLISAIGMSIFLSDLVQVTQGPRNKPSPSFLTGVINLTGEGDGYAVTLSYKQILIVAVTAVLLAAFWYLVQRTSLGRARRGASGPPDGFSRCSASTSTRPYRSPS